MTKLTTTITRNLYTPETGLVLTRAKVSCTIDSHRPWRETLDIVDIKIIEPRFNGASVTIPASFGHALEEKALDLDIGEWDYAEDDCSGSGYSRSDFDRE